MDNTNTNTKPKGYVPDEETAMSLADDMAQAATTFAGQGYQQFLSAREAFKDAVHYLYERRQSPRS